MKVLVLGATGGTGRLNRPRRHSEGPFRRGTGSFGTLCVDMRQNIRPSAAEKPAADTEAASVTRATAIPTAHAAS